MPQEILPKTLPAFYKLGTLADMTRMARKLALARKAIVEIRYIEDFLEANKTNVSTAQLVSGMKQIREYALMVVGAMNEAVEVLKGSKVKVASYQESVHDAID